MVSSSVALSSKFFISWHYRHRSNSVKISKSFSNSYICNNFAVPLIFVLYFCNRRFVPMKEAKVHPDKTVVEKVKVGPVKHRK